MIDFNIPSLLKPAASTWAGGPHVTDAFFKSGQHQPNESREGEESILETGAQKNKRLKRSSARG